MVDSKDKLETFDYKQDGDGCNPEQQKCIICGGTGRICRALCWQDCPECSLKAEQNEEQLRGNCPEQPNQNLMIIEEIEGLISQANEKLEKLEVSHDRKIRIMQATPITQALEEIDLFQKTTLFELRKAFE